MSIKSDHQSLFTDTQLLGAIVDTSEDAIVAKSATGCIVSWNTAAERLFGYEAVEAIGRHISIIIPADRLVEEEQIMRRLRAGDRVLRFETVRRRKDGQPVNVELSMAPVTNAGGAVIGAVKVVRDLRERMAARTARLEEDDRLRALSDELALTNRRKDEFLAALSHEIRNPLGAIRTGLTLMTCGQLDRTAHARTQVMVERQVVHLARLLDDLLDVSRSTHGRLTITKSDIVDARQVAGEAVAAVRPMLEATGVTLDVTMPDAPVRARADATRLQQILVNVLSNAARYTPPGGHAELVVRTEGRDLVAVVSDSGVGIPAALLPHVFEMFAQSQPDATASTSGLGIGLYLAREFAARHGGSISAASDGPGRGSTFTIRLPIVTEDHPIRSHGEADPADAPTPRRVLVVDDDLDNADGLALLIRLAGHQTEVAHDGPTAIEKARTFRPEVVILDIGLPGMDGLETCRQLRAIVGSPRPCVIAVTGWGQSADYERTRAAGFDHHLVKPVEPQHLLALLSAADQRDTV